MLRDRIQPFLPLLVKREMTNRELAVLLKVSETHLCRVLKKLGVVKEEAPNSQAKKLLNATRREFRIMAANSMSIKEAAQAAGCSVRTIYRLRGKS